MFNFIRKKKKERDGKHNIRFHLEQEEPMRNNKTAELVLTALFAAIIIIMAFTPLGYIPPCGDQCDHHPHPCYLGALFLWTEEGRIFRIYLWSDQLYQEYGYADLPFGICIFPGAGGQHGRHQRNRKECVYLFCTAYSCRNSAIFCIYRSKESTFFPAQNSLGKCV